MIKKTISIFCIFTFLFSQMLWAEIPGLEKESNSRIGGREYWGGRHLGVPLVSVNLINGVTRPGVYHVPRGTNVGELISFAGGAHTRSNLKRIIVRRKQVGTQKVQPYKLNLKQIMETTTSIPKVQDSDIVFIEQNVGTENTLRWISIVSGLMTIALTAFLISDRAGDND